MSKKDSVEFEIYKSDVLNDVRKRFGDNKLYMELAESLPGLGEEDLGIGMVIGMVMLGLRIAFDVDKEDLDRMTDVLLIARGIDDNLYEAFVFVLTEMCQKKLMKDYGN